MKILINKLLICIKNISCPVAIFYALRRPDEWLEPGEGMFVGPI
ncbi:hypothetical protein [Jejubacter sp. L23]